MFLPSRYGLCRQVLLVSSLIWSDCSLGHITASSFSGPVPSQSQPQDGRLQLQDLFRARVTTLLHFLPGIRCHGGPEELQTPLRCEELQTVKMTCCPPLCPEKKKPCCQVDQQSLYRPLVV
ncbi:hypothetical protein CRENBAI_001502 [Crenichthys baileyi]|uniref:Uncharacterized protein n=1 Tax=Crenichthys baileyi TaxID=28760 RepID=A0AAV9QN85_9TELE